MLGDFNISYVKRISGGNGYQHGISWEKNNHHVLGSLAGDNDLIFHGDIEPTFDDTSL